MGRPVGRDGRRRSPSGSRSRRRLELRHEAREALRVLARLKPRQRRAPELKLAGLSYREICAELGVTYTWVISRPSALAWPSWCARAAATCR
jgi:DNA-directed RNA polymerase specialized sigma24 family protein